VHIMSSLVLIDESYKNLDKITTRYSIGHAILNEGIALEFHEWVAGVVESDHLRFDATRKLHFTELSPAQRDRLVEKICKLPITFKVYVTYVNRAASSSTNTKLDLLAGSVRHHERNKPRSKYIVEDASEYRSVHRVLPDIDIESVNFPDNKALLLPDVLLGVFCGFLDVQDPKKSTDIIKWHTLIYNQIRLEVIDYQPKDKLFLTRDRKLI